MAGKRVDNVFLLLLYPREDGTHKNALEKLRRGLISSTWEYYCVEHDKDVNEDGELKKPHTHVVLFTHRKMAKGTLANALQIAENYTSYTNDVTDDLLYLTHNCPKGVDKYQYDDSEVETNSQVDYTTRARKETSRNLTDDEKLEKIFDVIDELEAKERHFDFDDVARRARHLGLGTYAMRNHQAIDKLIGKSNYRIDKLLKAKRGFCPVSDDEINPYGE